MIMAIFGAPKSYGNDAAVAARLALAMIEERPSAQQNLQSLFGNRHRPHTGEVGRRLHGFRRPTLNYTVLGERVNLASRLCSQAGGMEILMDEATRSHLPTAPSFTSSSPCA